MSVNDSRDRAGPVGPLPRLGAQARTTARRLRAGLRRQWRSSLAFRVIGVTILLGFAVLLAVGTYLYRQVADGLYEDRQRIAMSESLRLAKEAQSQFDTTDKTGSVGEIEQFAQQVVGGLAGSEGTRYIILARSVANDNPQAISTVLSGPVGLASIPASLREAVAANAGTQQLQAISVTRAGAEDPVPAIVVGQEIQPPVVGAYGLYFIYPLDREQATLSLVARTFGLGGLALILLVGAVAFVVTRLVVVPVREAAAVAVGFAEGHLNDRMHVKGEDDLARLATSFNEMAASLQQQIAQLENLSRVQQRFVSDVSHELRTPLTTIRMAGDLIHAARADFEPGVARSAELLHTQVDRFEALLADLLEISRFDAGAAALDIEANDLRGIVARVIEVCQPLADRRGSVVTLRGARRPCIADVDLRRVERILRNLLVNAIEHGDGGPIEVRLGQSETAVAVSVRDFGVGLIPGERELVFTRFWRADPARARTTGGTGLGLAISLEDARLHGGTLKAWGELGEGSCFRLTLPKTASHPAGPSPLPLGPEPLKSPPPAAVVAGGEPASDAGAGS